MRLVRILCTVSFLLGAPGCQGMDDGDLTEPPDGSHCHAPRSDYCPAEDVCVDLSTSLQHCGACGAACSKKDGVARVTCEEGACKLAMCAPGFADCDHLDETGCETDVNTSKESCGACGHACATRCAGGVCDDPIEVSAGDQYTCAVRALGSVWCWGNNDFYNLGDGTKDASPTPVRVKLVHDAIGVSTGKLDAEQHTCAVQKDETAMCWGANNHGQLGAGSKSVSELPLPVKTMNGETMTGLAQIATGATHTCAVTKTGQVYCWGSNAVGQLGTGQGVGDQELPVFVVNGVADVAVGSAHACAHFSIKSVECWGANASGQVGAGMIGSPYLLPHMVNGLPSVDGLALGDSHSCALISGVTLQCWGDDAYGQLGNGSGASLSIPKVVEGFEKPPQALFTGFNANAALVGDKLWVWGDNLHGQLGLDALDFGIPPTPTTLDLQEPVRRLAFGDGHACAILKSGRLVCWGDNTHGQLGDATQTPSLAPKQVLFPEEAP